MLLLDTNVYLDVDRDAALGRRVAGFLAAHGDSIGVCSVVVAELLIGVSAGRRNGGFSARR